MCLKIVTLQQGLIHFRFNIYLLQDLMLWQIANIINWILILYMFCNNSPQHLLQNFCLLLLGGTMEKCTTWRTQIWQWQIDPKAKHYYLEHVATFFFFLLSKKNFCRNIDKNQWLVLHYLRNMSPTYSTILRQNSPTSFTDP